MNRWIKTLICSLTLITGAALAQGIVRDAPKDVKAARMTVTAPPEIVLSGRPDRLSPGSRIRNLNNMVVLSGGLVRQEIPVVYRRDAAGLVHEVWMLTEAEYSKLIGAGEGVNPEAVRAFNEVLALIFGARR